MNTNEYVIQRAWTTLTDQVRERREERAAHRQLREELASYNTPAQVEDLMVALDRISDDEAAPMRAILNANLHHQLYQHHGIAS